MGVRRRGSAYCSGLCSRRERRIMSVPGASHGSDAYRLLMEQVIAGNGLPAVARVLSDMLALPATVADEEFEPLHGFAPRGGHLEPEEAALDREVQSRVSFD